MFTDQMPALHVFMEVRTVLASEFSTIYHVDSEVLKTEKVQFIE
jgi:hypothetical protein